MVSQYVDNELGPEEKKAFDAHIRSCASCRERLEEASALHELFASTQKFSAPYGFAARVSGALEDKEISRLRSFLSLRPFFPRTAKVTFALLVMTLGIVSGNLLLTERTNPMAQAAVRETFSLDLFQLTPPDSIGGIYTEFIRPSHEK